MTKKRIDWSSWWDGLRTNLIKCIGTAGTSWLGTNAIASIGVDYLKNMGLNLKQAGVMFLVHIGIEVFSYMRDNQPKVIVETTETTVETSKTVTTSQQPEQPKP